METVTVRIADREVTLSSLTLRDLDDLLTWARSRVVKIAQDSLQGVTDQGMRKKVMAAALENASAMSLDSQDATQLLQGAAGVTQLIYLSGRESGLTLDDLENLRIGEADLEAFMQAFEKLNQTVFKKTPTRKRKGRSRTVKT